MTSAAEAVTAGQGTSREDRAQHGPAGEEPGDAAAFRHGTARVNGGVRLHYVTGGGGPVIVALHGFPQTWREWRHVMPLLAGAGYTVLAPDLRGFGESDKPPGGYDAVTVSADLSDLITGLGIDRVGLVGHDAGASVGYAWAATHPEQVQALALIEAIPAGLEPAAMPGGPARRGETLWHPGFFRVPDLPEALITGRETVLLNHFFRQSAYDPAAFTDVDVSTYARSLAALGGLRGALAYHRARPANIADNRELSRHPLAMPVLAAGAAQSFGPKIADAARDFATDVTGIVAERCGHWIPEEQPVWLASQLIAFFAGPWPAQPAQ
jgi:pimeloyl-ACP methyl ester carboxylesterase